MGINGEKCTSTRHSVDIIINQLIISYSFWQSYLIGRVWLPFPCYDREFDIKTDVFA